MLHLLVLYCADLDACLAFYRSLGLVFSHERHGTGPAHVAAVLDGLVLELYPAGRRQPTAPLRIGLTVRADGTNPPLAPGRHVLRDPDDRTVEVLVS